MRPRVSVCLKHVPSGPERQLLRWHARYWAIAAIRLRPEFEWLSVTGEGVPRFVSTSLGSAQPVSGDAIEIDVSLEAAPAVLYDALVLPDGADAVGALRADGRTLEFIKDQYRHCKPILALGHSKQLLQACGISMELSNGQPDPGLLVTSDASATDDFVGAIAKHRHFGRETDPPRV